jgi:hypothetical protein
MGINERRFAWMDEGWTQMLSEYIQLAIDTTIDFRQRNVKRYLDRAGKFDELPMMYPSFEMKRSAYGYASYFRPAAAYNILKETLESYENGLFKRALKEFIYRWSGRNPSPYDFFFTFEGVSGQDLEWFWVPWFFQQGYPELGIDSVYMDKWKVNIAVNKEGTLPVPVFLEILADDGSIMKITRAADIWKAGDDYVLITEDMDGRYALSVRLGSKYIPDIDSTNNVWRTR